MRGAGFNTWIDQVYVSILCPIEGSECYIKTG